MTRFAAIVAVDHQWGIGDGEELPWRLPLDLKRFKSLSMGKPLIMGRRTHESIGRALPGRRNIVLSRDASYEPAPGCELATSFEEARALVESEEVEEAIIAGGAGVYEAFMPYTERVYLTVVHASLDQPVKLYPLAEEGWQVLEREHHEADDRHEHPFTFLTLERRPGAPTLALVPEAWRSR
jgi:dihydrofolate reductase